MTEIIEFIAEKKEIQGKGAARAARRDHKIPAIVYGGKQIWPISISTKEFLKEYLKGNIQSKLIEIKLNNKNITAITKEIQLHPVTDMPEHIDFQEINQNTQVKVSVHIRILNEDKCVGIKKGGALNVIQRSVTLRCHPNSIPKHIDVDIAKLEIGNSIHIDNIVLPKGVKPINPENFTIVSISGRAAEDSNSDKATTAESK